MHEFADLKTTMDGIIAYEQVFRQGMRKNMTPEKFAALEKEPEELEEGGPERDFVMERAKLEADREDAEEHRQELLRDHADRLRDEAIDLMVREPDEERFDRNTEPQDNIPSEAVKSDR
jgi:hypothetical protein